MPKLAIITTELGPKIAAFTCTVDGRPAAVVNAAARHDPVLRRQVVAVLRCAGVDEARIVGELGP